MSEVIPSLRKELLLMSSQVVAYFLSGGVPPDEVVQLWKDMRTPCDARSWLAVCRATNEALGNWSDPAAEDRLQDAMRKAKLDGLSTFDSIVADMRLALDQGVTAERKNGPKASTKNVQRKPRKHRREPRPEQEKSLEEQEQEQSRKEQEQSRKEQEQSRKEREPVAPPAEDANADDGGVLSLCPSQRNLLEEMEAMAPEFTIAQIAELMGTNPKALKRRLRKLKLLGVPVPEAVHRPCLVFNKKICTGTESSSGSPSQLCAKCRSSKSRGSKF